MCFFVCFLLHGHLEYWHCRLCKVHQGNEAFWASSLTSGAQEADKSLACGIPRYSRNMEVSWNLQKETYFRDLLGSDRTPLALLRWHRKAMRGSVQDPLFGKLLHVSFRNFPWHIFAVSRLGRKRPARIDPRTCENACATETKVRHKPLFGWEFKGNQKEPTMNTGSRLGCS